MSHPNAKEAIPVNPTPTNAAAPRRCRNCGRRGAVNRRVLCQNCWATRNGGEAGARPAVVPRPFLPAPTPSAEAAASALPPCRYCRRRRAVRPRGLCKPCHSDPEVRALFPSTSKFARRGRGPGHGGYALPAEPTRIPPGPLKVPVFEERARLGVSLWHPDDAT